VRDATDHLRALAQRIVAQAIARVPLRAALLTGSAGRADADFFSDLDLLLYVDALPAWDVLEQMCQAIGGTAGARPERDSPMRGQECDVQGIHAEITFVLREWTERRLDEVLTDIEAFDSPSQKMLSGLLEGISLHGEEVVDGWKARAERYPEQLRRPLIERHWRFFPLWYYADAMRARDAELWRLDVLIEAAFNILAILGALNRVYITRFQLKRTRAIVNSMKLIPPHLAERLEALPRLEPDIAHLELAQLVTETRDIVLNAIPEIELPLRFPPDSRIRPWSKS
jgi:hypothetical protein